MNRALTKKQARLLRFIRTRIEAERDPSYREMASHMGVASTNTVAAMLRILARKEYITWDPGQARSVRILPEEK